MVRKDGARGKQNRIGGSGIVVLAVREKEKCEGDEEGPAEDAIVFGSAREQIKEQAAEPKWKAEGIHHQDLLHGVSTGRVGNVFAGNANVVHQFEKRPVMLDVPN